MACLTFCLVYVTVPEGGGAAKAAEASRPPSSWTAASAKTASPVQLFDVVRGKVIRSLPNSPVFRSTGESWIASIRGAWGGFRLDPTSGYVLKVPFEPPLNVNNGWYRGEVTELYVMWDPATPHDTRLMLMGRGGSPRMFTIGAEAEAFVEQLRNG